MELRPKIDVATARVVLSHPLLQRLSTLSGEAQLRGAAKGSARLLSQALPGEVLPFSLPTPQGLIQGFATRDGKRLWIAGAMVRDSEAILRLGDLLPLVQGFGVAKRELALGIRMLQVGAGSPPSYAMEFRPGLLWSIREELAAQAEAGRILYSLSMGRVTVLGAFLLAQGKEGAISVKLVAPEGEQRSRIEELMIPAGCRDLEAALKSNAPAARLAEAKKKLFVPSMTQACAARYIAIVGGKGAEALLRNALRRGRLARPFDLIESLASVSPTPSKENLDAILSMVRNTGTVGADAACKAAPLSWTDALLDRSDLDSATRSVFTRCAWH